MTPNVGTVDRAFRLFMGIILLTAPFVTGMALFESGPATTISVIVGVVLIATSAFKFCPAYRILGIRTCKT